MLVFFLMKEASLSRKVQHQKKHKLIEPTLEPSLETSDKGYE
jgi:hypothetical protein